MKINFGCGDKRKEGYLHCDVRSLQSLDFECNVWDIVNHVKAWTVDEVYSRHMLEHLDFDEVDKTLGAWRTILKPGGLLDVEVPDLEYHIWQMMPENRDKPAEFKGRGVITNEDHAMGSIYGWQKNPYDFHKWGYTCKTLTKLLRTFGFDSIERLEIEPWNLRLQARKA